MKIERVYLPQPERERRALRLFLIIADEAAHKEEVSFDERLDREEAPENADALSAELIQ